MFITNSIKQRTFFLVFLSVIAIVGNVTNSLAKKYSPINKKSFYIAQKSSIIEQPDNHFSTHQKGHTSRQSRIANQRSFELQDIPEWEMLDNGLQLAKFPVITETGERFEVIIVKIDPHFYSFTLHMASQTGKALSLYDWSIKYGLHAVINASMYLPDGITSTGYLRNEQHINNGHIASRFGAFFVADPYNPLLSDADLLDRTIDDWENLLPQYKVVIQNYRVISASRQPLWSSTKLSHSIAAVARDGEGSLFFIHSRYPMSEQDFCNLLLLLPIDIRIVMYVEGGSQAGLLINTPKYKQLWMGKHPADILNFDNTSIPVPNVIGIKRKVSIIQPAIQK